MSLAAEAVQQLGESYLENLDSDRYRLTWVNADGMVILAFDVTEQVNAEKHHVVADSISSATTFLSKT